MSLRCDGDKRALNFCASCEKDGERWEVIVGERDLISIPPGIYRGEVNIAVGLFTVVAALWMVGLLRLPGPQFVKTMPLRLGPFTVGMAFALVTSPCSSPVLFAVLTTASQRGDPFASALAMIAYSVGYTAVLWAASVSTGLVATSRHVLRYGALVTRASAFVLAALGVSTVVYGAALLR